jgi:hypothetical protein
MRIHRLIIIVCTCFIFSQSMAQSEPVEKYRKFAVYVGAGPSYFFNNLLAFKNDVNTVNYAISGRVMWEPEHSFLSLGFETGYNRLYTVNSTVADSASGLSTKAHVSNSSVPLLFVVSMKFSKKIYADWSMGQSITFNEVTAQGIYTNHDATTWSLADFSATVGYRFIQKARISYAAEFKGYYSSSYSNGTLALLFIVGYRL